MSEKENDELQEVVKNLYRWKKKNIVSFDSMVFELIEKAEPSKIPIIVKGFPNHVLAINMLIGAPDETDFYATWGGPWVVSRLLI